MQPGRAVVEAAEGPQRLHQLVLRLGGLDPPDKQDVGSAARQRPRASSAATLAVGRGGDSGRVGQHGDDGGAPAAGLPELRLAVPALGQSEQGRGASSANSSAARVARSTLSGSQPSKYSGAAKLWRSRTSGTPCSARYPATTEDVVNWYTATSPSRRVLGIHPVLDASDERSSWIASAKISERQAGGPQGITQQQGMGAGGVVRVEGGDELVDGHRPPGGGVHRSDGAYGAVIGSLTAVTR